MQENSKDYKFCIELALDNAKKRINLLDNFDKNLCKKTPKIINSVLN